METRTAIRCTLAWVAASLWAVGAPHASAATLFSEDFESYAAGSDLNGQGGWIVQGFPGGPDAVPVNASASLPTKVLDGDSATGSYLNIATRAVGSPLPSDRMTMMSFDAYASSSSHNSWAGLNDSGAGVLGNAAIWERDLDAWRLSVFQSGSVRVDHDIGAVLGAIKFALFFDPSTQQVWGTYNDGSGTVSTPHFVFLAASISLLDTVHVGVDLRSTRGIELDNILVSSVPEPATALLFFAALPALAMVVRRRKWAAS